MRCRGMAKVFSGLGKVFWGADGVEGVCTRPTAVNIAGPKAERGEEEEGHKRRQRMRKKPRAVWQTTGEAHGRKDASEGQGSGR